MYGACNSTYLVLGSYCNLSCGRCAAVAAAAAAAAAPPQQQGPATVEAASGKPGGRRLARVA